MRRGVAVSRKFARDRLAYVGRVRLCVFCGCSRRRHNFEPKDFLWSLEAAVALVASVLVLSHQHYADRVPGVRAARPFAALPLLHFGRSTNCTRSDTHAWRFIPSAPHLSHLSHVCSPRSTWMIDTEKSVLENQYLVMQRDKEMEILDVKKGKDGKGGENYYRIKWGKVDATNVHFTWEPESNLPLAKETIDKWWAKPMVLRQNQFL